jgi:hypothetical protein
MKVRVLQLGESNRPGYLVAVRKRLVKGSAKWTKASTHPDVLLCSILMESYRKEA